MINNKKKNLYRFITISKVVYINRIKSGRIKEKKRERKKNKEKEAGKWVEEPKLIVGS